MSKTKDIEITEAAAKHVKNRFTGELNPAFLFHNYAYSEEIADKAETLAKAAGLDVRIQELLTVAGYFYPLGYIQGNENVAEHSAAFLREWAQQNGIDLGTNHGDVDQWVLKAHNASAEDELPVRLLYDAAWSWLGRKRYDRRSDLLQLERSAIDGEEGDPIKFGEKMQDKLVNFNYLTAVGKESFDRRRRKNASGQQSANYKTEQKEVKARTGKNFGRGIDTMYRTAFRNHINLSRIADGKANMMISINTIILSIVITVSGAGLSFFDEGLFYENPEFLAPIITLLLSSLIAVIFAVFSARPKVTEYRIKKTKGLLESKEASLLYFGNFLKVDKSDFIDYMATMKLNQSELYDDLARDLYDLGTVLHRKYLLLTISYNTFVGGLALSVVSFLIVYLLNLFYGNATI